jgi:hypothetical protein
MKSVILNVRISQELKNNLEKQSEEEGVTISDLIRNILNNHSDNETSNLLDMDYLYHSNQFLYLITWMFEKRDCAFDGKTEIELLRIKSIVTDVMREQSFPSDLKLEFEKVLVDLVRYINNYNAERMQFHFCKPNHSESFNYSMLIEYITTRAFENVIYL